MSLNGLDRNKVDGTANPAETFNRPLDFFTLTVSGAGATWRSDGAAGLDDVGVPNDLEQYLFDKMIELISQKAQPIILTGGGTGSTVFNFVVEHPTLWSEAGATDPKAESLDTVITDGILALKDDADNVLYTNFALAVVFSTTL